MDPDFQQQVGVIRSKLFAYCALLDDGDERDHDALLMSGCLSQEDIEFIQANGIRLRVVRESANSYLAQVRDSSGGACFDVSGLNLPDHRTSIALTELASTIHRIFLEGRNPYVVIEPRDGVRLLAGRFEENQDSILTILMSEALAPSENQSLNRLVLEHAQDVPDTWRMDDGGWSCSARVDDRRVALLIDRIVSEVFADDRSAVTLEWSENPVG